MSYNRQDPEFVKVLIEADQQYQLHGVGRVQLDEDDKGKLRGWTIGLADGFSIFCENTLCDQRPEPGEAVRLYGEGLGRPVRGIVIAGRVYRYKTEAEEEQEHQEYVQHSKQTRSAEHERTLADKDRRIAALPQALQRRIARFQNTVHNWRVEFEPYELFVCEEAAKFAEASQGALTWIETFARAKPEVQRTMLPTLSNEHSGNTFGMAVSLAAMLVREAPVEKAHGALCPLVGCMEYGCFAAYPD